jgi:outer membrane protein assembly factor BamE (lipoprotein component of BamABCDE complex)
MLMNMRFAIPARWFVAAFGLALVSCVATIGSRGFIPDEELISQLKTGLDTRITVSRVLGSPSSVSTFDDITWYYISKRTEQTAFFDEKVLDQQVLGIAFDDAGTISDIRRYAMSDGRIIDPVTRVTPTLGRELGVVEQLFGNLGRFNTGGPGNPATDY